VKITRLRSYMSRDGDRPRVLVAIDTDEGITGWGECYNHGPDRALIPALDYYFRFIEGQDPRRIEYLMLKLQQQARFPPGSIALAAFSALDQCLWDISAKAVNLPVYALIGGAVRDRVQVYLGLYDSPDPPAVFDLVAEAHERYGFTAFKALPLRRYIHKRRWGTTVAACVAYFTALREHCPEDYEFAFDGHAQIFEPQQAIQLGNAMAPLDPLFFEEPIRMEHIPAWTQLRAGLKCPLATGESLYNRYEFLALLAARGADIVQPDVCVVGGLSEMRRIATLAEAHYATVAPHNPMGPLATAVNVHFAAACTNFKILEYKLSPDAPYVVDPYLPVDGHLELRPDRPGWGVEIDETALEKDDYVHWERATMTRRDGSTAYP
jgi:galactonate dehydratase